MIDSDRDIITLTKAIGIILVVLAHAMPTEHILFKIIYVFHMPLFFIMSGYCFKDKYLSDAKTFLIRKIKGIYIPFVLFSLPFLYMHNVFCDLYLYNPADIYDWKKFLWDTGRVVTRMSQSEQFLCTFWFLKELFWGNLFFYVMMRLWKGQIIPTAISLLTISEIFILANWRIPYFSITFVSCFAAFFIAVGYWWRHAEWRLNKWWMWVIGLAIMISNMFIPYSSFIVNVTPSTLPIYVLPAIIGTIMVFEICRLMLPYLRGCVKNISLFIGNKSIFIMALHFLAFKNVQYAMIYLYHLPINKLYDFPIMYDHVTIGSVLICTILGVFLPLGVAWLWDKVKVNSLLSNKR